MICEKILGKVTDAQFKGKDFDFVEFEWHETYSKLHRKNSRKGRDIALRLDDSVLKRGIKPGDVLGIDSDGTVIVADVGECEILSVKTADRDFLATAKIAYEIGNCHAPLFAGKSDCELITLYTEPMERLLKNLCGFSISIEKRTEKLDFSRQISSIVGHSHHHAG
ncbi:MAG: hypothetical protein IJ207_13585 [Treponema sp.]|uniref:hypothetical protein n=1 Tax=Treponema sp. TaxID=166 RepID=UPI0025F85DAA|nr:hypothetical protein [Treponema sp.]MBQ9283206.1 hypothetical protein [Treponema sp.]